MAEVVKGWWRVLEVGIRIVGMRRDWSLERGWRVEVWGERRLRTEAGRRERWRCWRAIAMVRV